MRLRKLDEGSTMNSILLMLNLTCLWDKVSLASWGWKKKQLVETGQYREGFLGEENFKQNFEAVVYGVEKKNNYVSE